MIINNKLLCISKVNAIGLDLLVPFFLNAYMCFEFQNSDSYLCFLFYLFYPCLLVKSIVTVSISTHLEAKDLKETVFVDTIFVSMNFNCLFLTLSVQYHVDHNRVHFYVDDSSAANALHKCSHKITDTDGYKVCLVHNGNIILIAAESLKSAILNQFSYMYRQIMVTPYTHHRH